MEGIRFKSQISSCLQALPLDSLSSKVKAVALSILLALACAGLTYGLFPEIGLISLAAGVPLAFIALCITTLVIIRAATDSYQLPEDILPLESSETLEGYHPDVIDQQNFPEVNLNSWIDGPIDFGEATFRQTYLKKKSGNVESVQEKFDKQLQKAKSSEQERTLPPACTLENLEQARKLCVGNKEKLREVGELTGEEMIGTSQAQNYLNNFKIDVSKPLENVGIGHTQGRRPRDEDATLAVRFTVHGEELSLYAIMDGHGDRRACAAYVGHYLPLYLKTLLSKAGKITDESIANAFTKAMVDLNRSYYHRFAEKHGFQDVWEMHPGGTTVTASLQYKGHLYTANVGDTRALLVHSSGDYTPLSEDADPTNERFQTVYNPRTQQICKQTPVIKAEGHPPRLFGFALARDIGALPLSPIPKITKVRINEGDQLLIACDGVWDVIANLPASLFLAGCLECGSEPDKAAQTLTQMALLKGSQDNISSLIARF